MKYKPFIIALLYCFFLFHDRVHGIDERIITIGSDVSWNLVEKRQGVVETLQIRPHPVLALSSNRNSFAGSVSPGLYLDADLSLSFDEGHPSRFADSKGRYDVAVSPSVALAVAPWSRAGTGAALFTGQAGNEPIVVRPRNNALFAPGSYIRDFSIEFWLFPQNIGNGEQVLLWSSTKPDSRRGFVYQSIQCLSLRNRLQWTFTDFFFSPGQTESKTLTVTGPTLNQRAWSHHLIRFDADLGLLEYLVDGNVEAVEYATAAGREGGEVFTPVTGENCRFVLGGRFSGMIDEFRIYDFRLETPQISKYPEKGGRVETRALDLGHSNSIVQRIEAYGGRTESLQSSGSRNGVPHSVYSRTASSLTESSRTASSLTSSLRPRNEYVGNGGLSFSSHAEMQFFIRVSNNPHLWDETSWVPFNPGRELAIQGRFIQIAVDFYPSWDGETTPYLSELKVVYRPAELALPPARVVAMAKDGAVELSWRASASRDVMGYVVYYGTASGEYFGNGSIHRGTFGDGSQTFSVTSPMNVGNRTSIRIENLNNGTLYYFAVAAYNSVDVRTAFPDPGEFSRETAARPLRVAE